MSAVNILRFLGLSRNNSTLDRQLAREMKAQKVRRIVEIGVHDGERAEQLLHMAMGFHDAEAIRYTGIDMFEARSENATPLKQVHSRLSATGASVRLVPGDAATALPRCANDLRGTDWVLISPDQESNSIDRAWHFLPRMLHQKSQVWLETQPGEFQVLSARDVGDQLAIRGKRRRAA